MSNSSFRPPVQAILHFMLLIGLLVNLSVANDDCGQALEQVSAVQSAELRLTEAQLELEDWKHRQLENLHSDGFASWIEMRRHQFKVDAITARLTSAQMYSAFLSATRKRVKATQHDTQFVFHNRLSRPIKVYAPNSIRLIGWLEGRTAATAKPSTAGLADQTAALAKLTKAQQRFQRAIASESHDDRWREKARLELVIANRERELTEARNGLEQHIGELPDSAWVENHVGSFITANQNDSLQMETARVLQLEASARGHIEAAQILLKREQRRSDAVRRLHLQGHATKNELAIVNQRLANAKAQLNEFTENQLARKSTLDLNEDSIDSPIAIQVEPVDQWPDAVFDDHEFIMHLAGLRREYFREHEIEATHRLKAEFLQQVLDRLTAASAKSRSTSKIGSVLIEGERNELETYRLDIQLAYANAKAAAEKQQILVQEEKRFIHQTDAILLAAKNELASLSKPSPHALDWVGQIYPFSIIVAAGNKPLTRFSYLETGNLDALTQSNSLSLRQPWLTYVDSPYSFKSLRLYNLNPAHSSLVVSNSRRHKTGLNTLVVEPIWMKYFQRKLSQNSEQTLRLSGPPYSDAWPQRVYYGQYGYRAFGGASAYPNGILRADWRSNLTPGQVPWYAPGSPANIRANQLYYRRESKPYQRW